MAPKAAPVAEVEATPVSDESAILRRATADLSLLVFDQAPPTR
jgi:hypothetical protein